MALSTESSAGAGGRRRVDSSVNMIPFIDLLVSCIAFLIITAVWTQLERLDGKQRGGPPTGETATRDPTLLLRMADTGIVLVDEVGAARPVPLRDGHHDLAGLRRELTLLRTSVPPTTQLVVTPDDGQRYEEIVAVMDTALAARFDDLTMSGAP